MTALLNRDTIKVMNATPHTHKIQISRVYLTAGGELRVTYGDTTVRTVPWFLQPFLWKTHTNHPSEKRIRKAIAKAIRLHDAGSLKAGRQEVNVESILAEYNNLPEDQWASEVIAR